MAPLPKRYFKLSPDMTVPGRWSLGMIADPQGRELDNPWIFNKGRPIAHLGPLTIPMSVPGRALDLSYGGIATPVVHVRVASLLAELAPEDVQILPVELQGQPEQFCILVATRLIR